MFARKTRRLCASAVTSRGRRALLQLVSTLCLPMLVAVVPLSARAAGGAGGQGGAVAGNEGDEVAGVEASLPSGAEEAREEGPMAPAQEGARASAMDPVALLGVESVRGPVLSATMVSDSPSPTNIPPPPEPKRAWKATVP